MQVPSMVAMCQIQCRRPSILGMVYTTLFWRNCRWFTVYNMSYVYHPWLNHSYWYLGNTYEYHDSLVNHPWIAIASPHDMTRGSHSLGGCSQLSSRPFHFARWHPSWAPVAPGSGWMSQAGHQWFGWFGGPCGAAGHLRASGIEVTQMDQWSFRNLGGNIDD